MQPKEPFDILPGAGLNRHGTFLTTSEYAQRDAILNRALDLLKEVAGSVATTGERKTIVEAMVRDLAVGGFSKNIVDEGAASHRFSVSEQEIEWLKRAPEGRWVDYMVYRYEFKIYPAIRKLRAFPVYLLIEPTSVCNLRCVMCFQVDATFTKKEYLGYMSWELFTNVVDQAKAENTHAITLASRGEPTLHPKFDEMLAYIGNKDFLDTKINTNATRLNEKISHAILSAGVNEVVFSVDAGTKDTYESIRVNGKFDQVVANVSKFSEIRAMHYPNSPTVTRISGVRVREDQDETQMTEFWSQHVDQVTIKRATPRWDSYNNGLMHVTSPCSLLWERTYVWYDGKVNPCDFDYKSYLQVGDANTQALKDIWNGDKYAQLRKDHLERRRDGHDPCCRCPLS